MNSPIQNNAYLDYVPGIIWVINRDLEYQEIRGDKMIEWGINRSDVIGKTVQAFHNEQEDGINTFHHKKTFNQGKTSYSVEFLGKTYHCNLNHLPAEDLVVGVATDITNRLVMETKIQEQMNVLLEYSTPIVPVLENTVVLPIVGSIDWDKANYIYTNVIGKIHETPDLHFVIIDLSGVSAIETENADLLANIHKSLDLLGYTTIITGLQPQVAKRMIQKGVVLPRTKIFHSVKEALKTILN